MKLMIASLILLSSVQGFARVDRYQCQQSIGTRYPFDGRGRFTDSREVGQNFIIQISYSVNNGGGMERVESYCISTDLDCNHPSASRIIPNANCF